MQCYGKSHSEWACLKREPCSISIEKSDSFYPLDTGIVTRRNRTIADVNHNDIGNEGFFQTAKFNDVDMWVNVASLKQSPSSTVPEGGGLAVRNSRAPLPKFRVHFEEPARGAAASAATAAEPPPFFCTLTLPCET